MRDALFMTAASLAAVLAASAAFAHTRLEKATPGAQSTVASPSEIRLEFSEGVEPKLTGLTLAGPNGEAALGAPSLDAGHSNVLIVPVNGTLAPGAYVVKWHAVSDDTHRTQGTFGFTVK
jgi:methionine-rich copper-binding protein CopC